MLDDYAWELYNAHRFAEAVRLSDRSVGLFAQSDDEVGYGKALVRQSRHRYMAGDTEDAIVSANAGAVVLCTADRPDASAFAMTNLGSLLALGGEPTRAAAVLDEAARLADSGGRPDLVDLCLNYQSIARPGLSDSARRELLADSRRRSVDHGAHGYTARAYTNAAELLHRFLRFDDLQHCVDDGLSFTAEHGFRSTPMTSRCTDACSRCVGGNGRPPNEACSPWSRSSPTRACSSSTADRRWPDCRPAGIRPTTGRARPCSAPGAARCTRSHCWDWPSPDPRSSNGPGCTPVRRSQGRSWTSGSRTPGGQPRRRSPANCCPSRGLPA